VVRLAPRASTTAALMVVPTVALTAVLMVALMAALTAAPRNKAAKFELYQHRLPGPRRGEGRRGFGISAD
jgi:hypothetical protein